MAAPRYCFGAYELDLPRLELRRDARPIPLQPKALDLLIHLIRHRDRVVTKDELLSVLWPDVVVTEASLSKAVAAARRVLGDAGDVQTAIATVRGRGFRFNLPVEEIADNDASAALQSASARIAAQPEPDRGAFVGRQELMDAFDAALGAAQTGEGSLFLLAGDAGMGKTRAIQEMIARGSQAGFRTLSGWCHEAAGAPDLWPWRVALRPIVEGPTAAELADGLGDGLEELAELLPALRAHLPKAAQRVPLDAAGARFRRLETLAEIIARAVRSEPHLALLDDFHRADPDSLSLLHFVARALEGARLVVVVGYRVSELPIGHPLLDLARAPRCKAWPLAPLTRAQVAELVGTDVGRPISDDMAEAIRVRADGNPFFVKEFARTLASSDHLNAPEQLAGPLPAGIRNVLHEKLQRLSQECRELLVLAAMLGRDLDVALLAHASGNTPERALQLLDEARAQHALREVDGGLHFAHTLLRDEVLSEVSSVERARLHRTIAEALEAHYRDDLEPHLGVLAHHFAAAAAAGGADRALHYGRLAGERAVRLHAHREAADHYRLALNAMPLASTSDGGARCDVLLALGEQLMSAGEPHEGRAVLERAAVTARRIESPERFARAALVAGGLEISSQVGTDDPALVTLLEEALERIPDASAELGVRLRARLGEALYWSDWDRSSDAIQRAVADGRKLGNPVALGYALYGQHWLDFVGPGEGASLDAADEMLSLARSVDHRELMLAGRSCRFLVLLQRGRSQDAEIELTRYEALAQQLRVPRYRWRGHCYRAALAALVGELDEVAAAARRTVAEEQIFAPGDAVGTMMLFFLTREQDESPDVDASDLTARLPAFSSTWRAGIAVLLADAGRDDESQSVLEALVSRDFVDVPRSFTRLPELILCAEASAKIGDVSLATSLYEQLLPYRPRMVVMGGGFYCLGSVDLFLGRLAATIGDDAAARRHLEAAIDANERSGARPWHAWAQLDLARLLRQRDRDGPLAEGLIAQARETGRALKLGRLLRIASDTA